MIHFAVLALGGEDAFQSFFLLIGQNQVSFMTSIRPILSLH